MRNKHLFILILLSFFVLNGIGQINKPITSYSETLSSPFKYYFRIPIHVHIYHNNESIGSAANPFATTIQSLIDSVNKIFRNTNNLSNSTNTDVEFYFKNVGPGGKMSNGITRSTGTTIDPNYVNGIQITNKSGFATLLDAFTCNNPTGADFAAYFNSSNTWDPQRYFNIYIVLPSAGCPDGFFIGFKPLNTINASVTGVMISNDKLNARYLAHQLGHTLNLLHTYQGDMDINGNIVCPADNQINCSQINDECCDTEPHKRTDSLLTDECADNMFNWQNSTRFNIMNSYSASYAFTADQRLRMLAAVNNFESWKAIASKIYQYNLKLIQNTAGIKVLDTNFLADSLSNFQYRYSNPDSTKWFLNSIRLINGMDTTTFLPDSLKSFTVYNILKNNTLILDYILDTINNAILRINYNDDLGSISTPDSIFIKKGSSYRIEFIAADGFKVDSIFVNGLYIKDSIAGYTFNDIQLNQNLYVNFTEFILPNSPFIRNLEKYIFKPTEVIKIRGQNIRGLVVQPLFSNKLYQVTNYTYNLINNSKDSTFNFNLPAGLADGLCYVWVTFLNKISEKYLIRIYNVDSLVVAGWGNDAFSQINPPSNLNNVIKVQSEKDIITALQSNGKIVEWGLLPPNLTPVPTNVSNIVDFFVTNNRQRIGLLSNGKIITWGPQLFSVPDSVKKIVLIGGNDDVLIAIDDSNKVFSYNLNDNSLDTFYNPQKLIINDTIVKITGGNNYLNFLTKNATLYTITSASFNSYPNKILNVKDYSSLANDLTIKYNNGSFQDYSTVKLDLFYLQNARSFNRGLDLITALYQDSTVYCFGRDNFYDAAESPYKLKGVYEIIKGNYFNLALIKPYKITTQNLTPSFGNISNTIPVSQIGQNYTINFSPFSGYTIDYIVVDGVKRAYTRDSYTFTNVYLPHEIAVAFRNDRTNLGKPAIKFDKFIFKLGDTITVSGLFVDSFVFKLGNTSVFFPLEPLSKIVRPNYDDYRLVIPEYMPEGVYAVSAKNPFGNSDFVLVRLFKYDSLIAFGWGSNDEGETTIPIDIGHVVTASIGNSSNISLNTAGGVRVWGGTLNGIVIPSQVASANDIVDVFSGQGNQVGVIFSTGQLKVFGDNNFNQNVHNKTASNIYQCVGLSGALVCLTLNNTIEVFTGSDSGYVFNPPTSFTKKIAYIRGGLKHVLIVFEDSTSSVFGDNTNYNNYLQQLPSNTQKLSDLTFKTFNFTGYNSTNNMLDFGLNNSRLPTANYNYLKNLQRGGNFVVGIKPDSTIGVFGKTNQFGILTPPKFKDVKAVFAGSNHAIVLVQFLVINTKLVEGSGIIDPTRIIFPNQIGSNQTIFFAPKPGFALNYLLVNGVKVTDSLNSYTFYNVRKSQTIEAFFIDTTSSYIIKLDNYYKKAGDTLSIIGRNIKDILIKRGNYKDSMWFFNVAPVEDLGDAIFRYRIDLPSSLLDGTYTIKSKFNSNFSNTLLWNVFSIDSLVITVVGDTLLRQNKFPLSINRVQKVVSSRINRHSYTLAMSTQGEVWGWGFDYNNTLFNSNSTLLPNAIDVYAGEDNQNFMLLNNGSLYSWGENNWGQANIPEGTNDLIDFTGLGQGVVSLTLNVALKQNGTMVPWGRYVDSNYIKSLNRYKNVVKLDGFYALTDSGYIIDLLYPDSIRNRFYPYNVKDIFSYGYNNLLAYLGNDSFLWVRNNSTGFIVLPDFYQTTIGNNFGAYLTAIDSIKYFPTNFLSNNRTFTIPTNLRNVQVLSGAYSSLFLHFKLDARTYIQNDTGGTISPNIVLPSLLNNFRVTYKPDSNFVVDYVIINGARNYDSLTGYTFNNIGRPLNFTVVFVPLTFPRIVNLNGYIRKNLDTLKVTGRNINGFYFISRDQKLKYQINNIIKIEPIINSKDTFFSFIVPAYLKDDVWRLVAYNKDTISNNILVRVYKYDSLVINLFNYGNNFSNYTNIPNGIKNVIQVLGRGFTNLAFDKNGKLFVWGQNASLTPTNPNLLNKVVQIYSGIRANQIFALRGDGTIVGWGLNTNGLLSNIDTLYNIIDLAIHTENGLAINSQGKLLKWGNNWQRNFPVEPNPNDTFVAVSAGQVHFLTLTNYGKLSINGLIANSINYTYQLPDTSRYIYKAINASNDFFNVAVNNNDSVICWGRSSNGFGSNITSSFSKNISSAVRGYAFTAILTNADSIQLAIDPILTAGLSLPRLLSDVKAISAGDNHVINIFQLKIKTQVVNPIGGTVTPTIQLDSLSKSGRVYFYPNKGYVVDSVWLNDSVVSTNVIDYYDVTNVRITQNLKVKFKIQSYFITPIVVNGIINPNSRVRTTYFDSVRFIYAPIDPVRFQLDSVFINNILFNDSMNSYTFRLLDSNSTIRVVFKLRRYRIKNTAINGNIKPQDTLVNINSNLTTSFTPNIGYEFDSLFVDNMFNTDNFVPNYRLTNITDSHYILIKYKIKRFKVYTSVLNGSIDTLRWVDYGSKASFQYTPRIGYELDSIFLNNLYVGSDSLNQFTINNITDTQYLYVKFRIKRFVVNIIANNGFLNNDKNLTTFRVTVNYGDDLSVSYEPNIGYFLRQILLNNVDVGIDSMNRYSFDSIINNINLTINYSLKQFTVNSEVVLGTINPVTPQIVYYGSSLRYTYSPSFNCILDSIIVNGVFVSNDSFDGFTIENITDNTLIRVVFKEIYIIPSPILTPNGDGINDYWFVANIHRFPENKIFIYNSFNLLVRTFLNYNGFTHWDGSNNYGQRLENGTYYYVIILYVKGKTILIKKGTFILTE